LPRIVALCRFAAAAPRGAATVVPIGRNSGAALPSFSTISHRFRVDLASTSWPGARFGSEESSILANYLLDLAAFADLPHFE
jgi:hypothetical protein